MSPSSPDVASAWMSWHAKSRRCTARSPSNRTTAKAHASPWSFLSTRPTSRRRDPVPADRGTPPRCRTRHEAEEWLADTRRRGPAPEYGTAGALAACGRVLARALATPASGRTELGPDRHRTGAGPAAAACPAGVDRGARVRRGAADGRWTAADGSRSAWQGHGWRRLTGLTRRRRARARARD